MRLTVAAIVFVGLPAAVAAQTSAPPSSTMPSLPAIGLPLPRIGLPLATIGLPSPIASQSRSSLDVPRGIENRPQRFDRNGSLRSHRSDRPVVFFFPTYGWHYGYPALEPAPTIDAPIEVSQRREPETVSGSLRLEVEPAIDVQLYVDGYYAGTLDDVRGELEIEAGLHRIEIRAPGFETLEVNVRIAPGRAITYRGALKREKENSPAPAVQPSTVGPLPSKTSYFIPGCYLGNVPPKDVNLPATCDLSRTVTFTQ